MIGLVLGLFVAPTMVGQNRTRLGTTVTQEGRAIRENTAKDARQRRVITAKTATGNHQKSHTARHGTGGGRPSVGRLRIRR